MPKVGTSKGLVALSLNLAATGTGDSSNMPPNTNKLLLFVGNKPETHGKSIDRIDFMT